MFETHVCPCLQGWCPICDSEIGIDDEIFALAPGSAIRTDTSFWIFSGIGEGRDLPVLFHRDCARRWLHLAFADGPVIGVRDLTGPEHDDGAEED